MDSDDKTAKKFGIRPCVVCLGINPEVVKCLWCTLPHFFVSQYRFILHAMNEHKQPVPQRMELMLCMKGSFDDCGCGGSKK